MLKGFENPKVEEHMNEDKFSGKGSIYSASRPKYPESLFEYLRGRGILTPWAVAADIGSGTGIFSMQLAQSVKTVFAVEPNSSMHRAAQRHFEAFGGRIVCVRASAEHTGLQSGSIDCVTAAQAFHWFDRRAFEEECCRILKPKGWVVLVWNDRDEASEIIRRCGEINAEFCPGYRGFSNGMNVSDSQQFTGFFKGDYEACQFENVLSYDLETFLGRSLSSSYAPREGEENYKGYVRALTRLFEEHSSGGAVAYPYVTRCYLGTVQQSGNIHEKRLNPLAEPG